MTNFAYYTFGPFVIKIFTPIQLWIAGAVLLAALLIARRKRKD